MWMRSQGTMRKEYSGGSQETVQNLHHIFTLDRGFLFAVDIYTPSGGQFLDLLKLDSSGGIQWQKRIGPMIFDFENITESPDSGYFVCLRNPNLQNYYTLYKFDITGAVAFSINITPAQPYAVYDTPQTFACNDGTVLIGCTLHDQNGLFLWHLMRVSDTGVILWSNAYNLDYYKYFFEDIDTCSNGDIILLGASIDTINFSTGPVVTRLTPAGSVTWSKFYSHSVFDYSPVALSVQTGDYINILTSQTVSGYEQMGVTRMDPAGNEVWSFNYFDTGVNLFAGTIVEKSGHDAIILSGTFSSGAALRIDTAGTILWGKCYPAISPSSLETSCNSIGAYSSANATCLLLSFDSSGTSCQDSLLTVSTSMFSFNVQPYGNSVALPTTVASSGSAAQPCSYTTITHCEVTRTPDHDKPFVSTTVYPNPATEYITIDSRFRIETIEILDLSGRTIVSYCPETNHFELNVSFLAKGFYQIKLFQENSVESQSLIIE